MPKKRFPENALDDLVSESLASKLRLLQDHSAFSGIQDALRAHENAFRPMLDAIREQENRTREIAESMKFTTPALDAVKAFQPDPALLEAARRLDDVSGLAGMKALASQLDAAASLRSSLLGSGVLDQINGLSSLTEQWRSAFEVTKALPLEAFGNIKSLAEQVRAGMPSFPTIDPAIFGGTWNDDLAAAVSRVRERAEAIASDPDAGVEDVEAFVADTAAVVASTPEPAQARMRAWARIVAYWVLGNLAWEATKEVVPNAVAALILVLATVAGPPARLPELPPRPALPAPGALVPAPLPVETETGVLMPGGWQIHGLPDIIRRAGPQAERRTIEFFMAEIRNPNTRTAYAHAVMLFMNWCEDKDLELADITPFVVAAYVEKLGRGYAAPTVKQHLAAIRMLFDYLVVGQVLPMNPASAVRGPKHVVRKGKTPVLQPDEARLLLDSIDVSKLSGLRDRALLGVMVYSFARVSAVVGMDVNDYYQQGKRWWLRLHEKGGKHHELPVHHKAEEYLDAYIEAAGIGEKDSPLWRTLTKEKVKDEEAELKDRRVTPNRMTRVDVFRMIKRRMRDADLGDSANCHTFRATGITAYLLNGGTLERAQAIAAHESPRTTKLYDRTADDITVEDIERIGI